MFRVIPPHLSELAATTCSAGTARKPGWFYPISSLGFPARGTGGLVCSWALPPSLPGSFLLRPQLIPRDEQAKLQPQQNSKCRCARGAARATRGAAVLEGCVWAEQWWVQRRPSGEDPAPHPCPQPPQSRWARGAVIPISEQPVPPRHLAGPALSPAAPTDPYPVQYPQLGARSHPDGPKHLNLEPRLDLALLNMVVTAGQWEVPPDLTWSMLQPLHKPCPLSQKRANCLNHALRKTSEINNPQAEVLLEVSWPQMF